ncbi:MAG TPA: hypothetical protein VIM14_16790 [Polyangia bacterium]|jgi:hypothetical protein
MVFGCAALSLAPAWGPDAHTVIVPSLEAIRLVRDEGYQHLYDDAFELAKQGGK